jgi:hypothetical protein
VSTLGPSVPFAAVGRDVPAFASRAAVVHTRGREGTFVYVERAVGSSLGLGKASIRGCSACGKSVAPDRYVMEGRGSER